MSSTAEFYGLYSRSVLAENDLKPVYIENSRPSRQQKRKSSLPLVLLFAFIFLFIFQFAARAALSSLFVIDNIKVSMDSSIALTEKDILILSGLDNESSFFKLKSSDIEQKLLKYPLIKSAQVAIVFPGTVKINITGRTALALALYQDDGMSIPLAVDEEGVIFLAGRGIENWNLPVISGLKFSEVRLGMRLPDDLLSTLTALNSLKLKNTELYSNISEIKLEKKNNLEYEVLLYMLNSKIRVRTGREIDPHVIKYALMVLDAVDRQGLAGSMNELDFRTGEIVFRTKEG